MTYLSILFWFKIIATLLLVVIPFVLLPAKRVARLSGFGDAQPGFFKIYGIAILALLFGYYAGIQLVEAGHYPRLIILMGIVSNLGAALVLLFGKFERRSWPSIVLFGLIAAALIWSFFAPSFWIQTL